MKLFIDTWGWVELRDARGIRHQEMERFYLQFRRNGGIAFTTDFVLDETLTHLFRRAAFSQADESFRFIEQAIADGFLRLERIDAGRFEQAVTLRRRYQDKPRISFTDFTSMIVMQELGIVDVMTEDDHFAQVGMGFNKIY